MTDDTKGALSQFGSNDQLMGALSQLAQNPIDENRKWLASAAGWLAPNHSGSYGEALGNSLKAMNDTQGAQEKLKASYVPHVTQALIQAAQFQRQREIDNMLANELLGGGSGGQAQQPAAMPGQLGSGTYGTMAPPSGMPSIPATNPQAATAGRIASMTPEKLAMFKRFGVDLLPEYKLATEGFERKPGSYYDIPGQGRVYIPDPTKGIGLDQSGNVVALPGFSQTNAGIEAAKAGAIARAQNDQTPLKPSEFPMRGPLANRPLTVGQYVDIANGGATGVPSGQGNGGGSSEGPQGLDLSKLSPQQIAYLQKQDPEAFANGVTDFAQTSQKSTSAPDGGPLMSPEEKLQMEADIARRNKPGLEYATNTAKNMADYEKSLNDRVSAGGDLMMRIAESRDTLQKFQAGGGTEFRTDLAKIAQGFGAPQKMVDKIAGGDLSAAQEFQKLAATQAMETLKQSLGQGGRITQAEFKVFQHNNPNLDTDPNAIEKVYNFATKVYERDKAEQDALNQYKSSPNADISSFPNWWATQSQKLGYVEPKQVTGEAKGTSPKASPMLAKESQAAPANAAPKIMRTGTHNGRKVIQYSDGSIKYAD